MIYRIEQSRGYEYEGTLWSPGVIRIDLEPGRRLGLIASVESWDSSRRSRRRSAAPRRTTRREDALDRAIRGQDEFAAQLVLAADQFLIRPRTRAADEARARPRATIRAR